MATTIKKNVDAEKITKAVATLQAKIDRLSGSYLTNTFKRQKQQRERDRQRAEHESHKNVLEYLGEEVLCRELTAFESALIVNAFYDDMWGYHRRRVWAQENPRYNNSPVKMPTHDETAMNRFAKAGIQTDDELHNAIESFEQLLSVASIAPDPKAARLRDLIFKARLYQEGDIQFTPDALASRLVQLAEVKSGDIVLEPSAGIGSIADEAKKAGATVKCVERMGDFREVLKIKGYELVGSDFLECETEKIYDAVVMNPPFSAECEHLRHAYDFVKEGGMLVAVCCVRIHQSSHRRYVEFRDWLDGVPHYFEDVTEKFESTGAGTMILVIEK